MSLNVVSLFSRANRPRSWSNQELAEFYRVQGSLVRAGVDVETEQGFSDEGDPWFVFCRSDSGDVIIHFARIDGLYIVASPAFGSCVRGRDFRLLIEGLIEQHPVVMPREKEKGKFLIHPAALLVALVTTAFFKLYQGDALAADGRDDSHGPHVSGNGARPGASAQSHSFALDERAAATLMVAVAVAVAWEQVTNSDGHIQVGTTPVEILPASLPTSPVPEASAVHVNLQDMSASDGQTSAALDPAQAIVHDSPSVVASTVQTTPQANLESPAPSPKADADPNIQISAPAGPAAMGGPDPMDSLGPNSRTAEVLPEHSNPPQQSGEQHASNDSGAATSTHNVSAALVEVRAVIGELIQAHLSAGRDAPELQFVLSLINNQPDAAPPDGNVSISGSDPSKTQTFSASTATGTGDSKTMTFSASSGDAPALSPIDQAIHDFISHHSDFQIIKLDYEVIMYDPALTPSNSHEAEQENFTFSDGSSLLLIGLPAHNPATVSIGV